MAITREDYVEQSVQSFAKKQLFDVRGYPRDQIEFLESFDDNMFDSQPEPRKNYVAAGYDFDDDGRQAELGSDLIQRMYTFEFFIIGTSSVWGKNLAQGIKFGIEQEGVIPLLDIEDTDAAPDWPEIDRLILDGVSSNRVIVQDPAPWQRHIWVTRARVLDVYYANLT